MTWFKYDGGDGIDAFFDPVLNKSKKHFGDDNLVPFKTKVDKNTYVDFSGVVGEFSRLMSETTLKKNVTMDKVKELLREKVNVDDESSFEKLYTIVQNLYFKDGKLIPISNKALSLIDSNITQKQVAEYLYSLFVKGSGLSDIYQNMADSEDSNALEKCLFEMFEGKQDEKRKVSSKAQCYIPFIKDVFIKDYVSLVSDPDEYKTNITRLLSYYYMIYINQLAIKLSLFDKADCNKMKKYL